MRAAITGIFMGLVILFGCGAVKWNEPPSWTLREDGHLKASQRKEDFTFAQWKAAYLDKEHQAYGICLAPSGAQEINAELSRRNAKIIELQNFISNGCGGK